MKPSLLVLAAGMGSRYGGLKQMDPMGPGGETVLDYSVFDAIRAGFGRVVFVIREDFAEAFRNGIGSRFADRIEVEYAFQKPGDLPPGFTLPENRVKPWGTAHAVRAAREVIDGPFAVINADDFYGRDAYERAASFLRSSVAGRYAMVGYPLLNTLSDHGEVNRGICLTGPDHLLASVEEYLKIKREADGLIRGISLDGSRKIISEDSIVSMNFWAFTDGFFDLLESEFTAFLRNLDPAGQPECYIPSVVDSLIRGGMAECQVLETTSHWFGITYPDDKPHVVHSIRALIAEGEYPASLS